MDSSMNNTAKVLTTDVLNTYLNNYIMDGLENHVKTSLNRGMYDIEICKLDHSMYWILESQPRLLINIENHLNVITQSKCHLWLDSYSQYLIVRVQ